MVSGVADFYQFKMGKNPFKNKSKDFNAEKSWAMDTFKKFKAEGKTDGR